MKIKRDLLTRILAILGTVLVWLPIAAPLLLGLAAWFTRGRFLLDWLMPAELSLLALAGGLLLLWAALWRRRYRGLVAGAFGPMVLLLAGIMIVPEMTGLASGRVQPGGWQMYLVLGMLAGYVLAMAVLGIGGIMLIDVLSEKLTQGGV